MKTQLKKSLSLFLAVLMILSCWVWVAPEKAAAITNDNVNTSVTVANKYRIKLGFALNNDSEQSDTYVEYKIWCIDQNGNTLSGYTTVKDYEVSSGNKEGGAMHYEDAEIPGFPYYIECATYRSDTGTSGQHEIVWNYIEVHNGNGTSSGDIFTDVFTIAQRTGQKWSVDKAWLLSGYSAPDDADATHTQTGVNLPFISGFDSATSTDLIINLGEIGTDPQDYTITFTESNFYDQYGVKWSPSTKKYPDNKSESVIVATTENGTTATSNADISAELSDDGKSATLTVDPNLQTSDIKIAGNNPGVTTYYVVKTLSSKNVTGAEQKSVISAKVTIKYPEYTVKYSGAGSIADLTPIIKDKNGNVLNLENNSYKADYTSKGYYSTKYTPATTAEADGYTFYGFWTVPQPSEGNGSYNAKKADFAIPCTTDEFISYGGTADGKTVTYDGQTYYNAGAPEKALDLSRRLTDELFVSTEFFLEYYDLAKREFESCYSCLSYVSDLAEHYGDKEYAAGIRDRFNALLDIEE